jgi:hypothetical protein
MEYAPKVQRNDFVRLPWGVPPNIVTPLNLADGTPPSAYIALPGVTYTSVTFTWVDSVFWEDDAGGSIALFPNGEATPKWEFLNQEDSVSLILGAVATTNPFAHYLWGEQSGYSVDQTVNTVDYRIVWYKHQSDDQGGQHHTSMVIELEDGDT